MKYLILTLFVLTLVACKTKKQGVNGRYFEGTVEYNSVYDGADTVIVKMLKKTYGVRIISFINEQGYVKREFIDTNNIIIFKEIYRPDSLKVFFLRGESDTVQFKDVTNITNTKIISETNNCDEKILGDAVDMIKTSDEFKYKATNKHFFVYSTYYNDINYQLSPFAYKNVISGQIENIFSFSPHITTKYIFQYGNGATITSAASRIVPSVIAQWQFDIPKNKIIVQQPR